MEVKGKIKKIDETKTFGASGFRKREVVVTTNEQYPQMIMVEFTQDKCDLLNDYKVGQDITISINLRGREWINPQGEAKYFNSIQGWRVELDGATKDEPVKQPQGDLSAIDGESDPNDDLPF